MKIYSTIFLCLYSYFSLAQSSPSFDCEKATTDVEHAICESTTISQLDSEMSLLYQQYINKLPKEHLGTAKKMQRLWIKRRGKCSDTDKLTECIEKNYSKWLEAMHKGVLLASIPIGESANEIRSPFNSNTLFKLKVTPSTENLYEGVRSESYELYLTEKDSVKTLHSGNLFSFGNDYKEDKILRVLFYLSVNGKKHVALMRSQANYGGRCSASRTIDLHFLANNQQHDKIKKINMSEADEACGTYYSELYNWEVAPNGNLIFSNLEDYSFYHQQVFTEIKATEIDSEQGSYKSYYWVDPSNETYLGVEYSKIIEDVERGIWGINNISGTELCVIPGNGLSDYWRLKEILSQYKLGFNQIEFYSQNILAPEKLRAALQYRPLLEAALFYLNEARKVPNWKNKIVESAKKYPQIQASSNFYYSGDSDWDFNPFVEAGFYTDNNCYSQQSSPWSHASMEEWYYLFWARRIEDGYLERAENILRLVINMMDVIQSGANKSNQSTVKASPDSSVKLESMFAKDSAFLNLPAALNPK